MKKFITTPLYYVNARPHLGHAYTTIVADIVKRHNNQRGQTTVMLTGTDEHGEKIAKMAALQNKTPKELADKVSEDYKSTWQKMDIDFDIFYRTTDPSHVSAVKNALTLLKEKGQIVFREYEGNYCVGCERFLTDNELTATGTCPDHQVKPEIRKEANYFFLMSQYRDRLLEFFEKNPDSIRPEQYRTEILSFLKQPLTDLCISRPKERLTWGIELPFDSKFVTYVWVDALLNYLAATGWPNVSDSSNELWDSVVHLIGKDIVKTHAIYWTAILMALDVKPFKQLHVNGFLLMGGTKMSKSLGNVIRPLEVEALYGKETLRFYLAREMSYGQDSTFTLESYVACINAYLANGIGNLASRVITLCLKNFSGKFPKESLTSDDKLLQQKRLEAVNAWNISFEELKYQNALKAWSELVTACDLYVNDNKPWALAKDPAQKDRLHVVLGVCLQTLQTLATLIYPVLPHASLRLLTSLGISVSDLNTPPQLSLASEERYEFNLQQEVPKLFARVSLPVESE